MQTSLVAGVSAAQISATFLEAENKGAFAAFFRFLDFFAYKLKSYGRFFQFDAEPVGYGFG